ncbi:senescence marker protein-30 (SMP-30) [Variovorax sp. WS11]|uniref:SMP-30/gluconolactonase/LRE family protein n=1 Tax=Variovorax sp. WS11 TaxID=1105204 RepID=UPI000D0D2DDD|nr:SMP-30/gluconolactonase/LRE family protein [Variovorax sp. WS11]NDZ17456.1 SMP-30/gluconolactonase/LRE family protein [Variovorax sp. WS11]PSL86009.1 senescence marker protein-30 (SMP-30) [Variovorax sp. WS11]
MASAVRLVADCGNSLGEGPLWDAAAARLWWIDVARPQLWCLESATGTTTVRELPKPPGSFALLEGGDLLMAFRSRMALLSASGEAVRWLDVPGLKSDQERFNDGKVDRRGRFWVGTLDRALHQPVGQLYGLQDGSLCSVAGGATLSNGIGWSPDNRTMYFTDTHTGRIDAFDFDIASGTVRSRWPFVQVEEGPGGPDGLTVDAEGGVWSAQFGRGVIHRYLPDGRLHRVIQLPVTQPTSCMFGGPDLRTLYITTARHGLDAAALEAQPWAGGLLAVDTAEHGIAEPRCSFQAL